MEVLAEDGIQEIGEMNIPIPTGGSADSPSEESVQRVLQLYGYKVAFQVGLAGFRIDLAVCHPKDAGCHTLAIECDGARYRSSSWARERDRLRQSVLESKRWAFHRIWSTDGFQNRKGETKKLISAIERAKVKGHLVPAPSALLQNKVERVELVQSNTARTLIHEASLTFLARLVQRVVEVEDPVHVDIVQHRSNRGWGNTRMGTRIRAQLDAAIRWAEQRKMVRTDRAKEFLDRYGRSSPVVPRDRSWLSTSLERNPAMLPPLEIRVAALAAVRRSLSATPNECAKKLQGSLAMAAIREGLRNRIEPELQQMVAECALVQDGEYFRAVS